MPQKLADSLGNLSKTLYLVDVSSFIYRAYFAIRNLRNKQGEPTNAVYGVATMLAKLADDVGPEYLAVVYDSREPSFRKEMYPEYKANRSAPPDDLIPQFAWIEELIRCMEIPTYRQSGVEADDLIASLVTRWCDAGSDHRAVVVTGDKDLMQWVSPRVRILDTMNNKIYAETDVEEKFGVKPLQIRDYLALVGDSSDNIPGVAGVGPKTAADLLRQFGTLEDTLEAALAGKIPGKKGETLKSHVDDARMSSQLASLRSDLEVKIDFSHLAYRFHVTSDCVEFLQKMDFHSLITKWSVSPAKNSTTSHSEVESSVPTKEADKEVRPPETKVSLTASPDCFRTIQTETQFSDLLASLERTGEFAFDLETTSLNPREAELVGIAIAYDDQFGCYIPVGHRGFMGTPQASGTQLPLQRVLEGLRPFLQDCRYKKMGQNLKYDCSVLAQLDISVQGLCADTMVASYVLDPEGRHNLETLASRYLGYTVMTYEEVCGKAANGHEPLCFDQVDIATATRYSAEDAWITLRLWRELKPRLEAEGLMDVFVKVDLPLVAVLGHMESQGVCIDVDWLKKLSRDFEKEMLAIDQRIQSYSKSGPVNLNSPKQLARLLFEELALPAQGKTKTGLSTDAQVLEALSPLHEVPRLLLEYREISKLKGTYIDPLPLLRDAKTGKIHASFHQAVTVTGRLSSSDPNLQNIPIRTERGRLIRRAFIPSPGHVLISADYSQIELRLLAHMSGDAELVNAFSVQNEDVHRRTAAEVFGVSPAEVTERQRGMAKAVNFGLMYGKTAFGLAQELKISRREAADMIERYFARYRGVKLFLDRQVAEAHEKGWTSTLSGRKRFLKDINSKNPAVRANAERMAMNAPIQGTAADLMKLAMTQIDEELTRQKLRSRLIIQVHDEVVLDCPKEEAATVEALVVRIMEQAMSLSVPLRVNAASGENWMDL